MFDDDEDRDGLLIDEHDQSNGDLEKHKASPLVNTSVADLGEDSTLHGIDPNTGLNSSREEGELEDDEMDTSSYPITPKKVEDVNSAVSTPDRKRANGDSETQSAQVETAVKRSKVSMVEKSTCVQSEASQADLEESVFEMEAGSSFTIQMTVVCRLEGTDTVYVSAKWKDRELSGILTDGEPPGFANFAKKRMALNNNNVSESEKNGLGSTPKKRVRGQEAKKKNKADEDEEDLDVTGLCDTRDSSCSGGSVKLVEVNSASLHYCPEDGCEHAYPTSAEMEYHISTIHKKRSVIFENNSTQTLVDNLPKTMVSVQTDTEGLSFDVKPKLEKTETNGDIKDEQSDGRFSDISDDAAPVLLKEEPRAGGGDTNRPSTSSVPTTPQAEKTLQAAIVQPTQVVPPIAASPRANGLLIPAATFVSPFSAPASSAVVTPTRDVRTSSASNVSDSASKTVASPAQSRGFHPMMHQQGPGPSQAAQMQAQMYQAAQIQQLMMQQMMGGGRAGYMQPMPNAQEIAALQALQAGQYQMFNTKP